MDAPAHDASTSSATDLLYGNSGWDAGRIRITSRDPRSMSVARNILFELVNLGRPERAIQVLRQHGYLLLGADSRRPALTALFDGLAELATSQTLSHTKASTAAAKIRARQSRSRALKAARARLFDLIECGKFGEDLFDEVAFSVHLDLVTRRETPCPYAATVIQRANLALLDRLAERRCPDRSVEALRLGVSLLATRKNSRLICSEAPIDILEQTLASSFIEQMRFDRGLSPGIERYANAFRVSIGLPAIGLAEERAITERVRLASRSGADVALKEMEKSARATVLEQGLGLLLEQGPEQALVKMGAEDFTGAEMVSSEDIENALGYWHEDHRDVRTRRLEMLERLHKRLAVRAFKAGWKP